MYTITVARSLTLHGRQQHRLDSIAGVLIRKNGKIRIVRNSKRNLLNIITRLVVFGALVCVSVDAAAQKWELTWSDEFNGPKGVGVDAKKWSNETGGSGWGNKELEYYTAGAKNSYQNGTGSLVITATKETQPTDYKCWYGPCQFTSARLSTKNKFAQTFGRIEARIKVPAGEGMWPAFWMLGSDIDAKGWPVCGEIDIMENIGREPSSVHGTLHGPGYSGSDGIGAPYQLASGESFSDNYHVFAVEWEPHAIRWFVDGHLYQTRTPADLPPGKKWVYDHPFFLILNLAVGGAWPGSPTTATTFPGSMLIDFVRVYKRLD
jgi:beta-glucanase (GH16 family)